MKMQGPSSTTIDKLPMNHLLKQASVGFLRAVALLVGVASCFVSADAARFEITAGDDGNQVEFFSTAPMESFSGKTDQISGWLDLDPASVGDTVGVRIEVDLASLDTGIDLRNQHMRENHLETETYPVAVFEGAGLGPALGALAVGKTLSTTANGTFDLHGVRKPMQAQLELTLMDGGALRVSAQFDVLLEDHKISRPKFLFLKLNEKQEVTVDFTARPTED